MKKSILALAATGILAFTANAEILRITFNNGTSTTYNVSDVKEMTFEEESEAAAYAGSYTGTNSVSVGGMFTYMVNMTYTVEANADGTVNLHIPTYTITGTVMGDLTLGEHTISNIAFDEAKNAFYREYGQDGIKMHFTAVNNGQTTMDNEYEFINGNGSVTNVLIEKSEAGLKVTDTFRLGAMPFEIVGTFTQDL